MIGSDKKMQLQRKYSRFWITAGAIPAVSFLLVCNVGCFSPVALSTVETTGNEAPGVLSHFSRGQAEVFLVARYDAVVAATRGAARSLSMELIDNKVEETRACFRFRDAMKDRVDVFIVRRSETVTSIKYDVGWFGSAGLGHLVLREIISELHHS